MTFKKFESTNQVCVYLRKWVRSVLGEIEITFCEPNSKSTNKNVNFYLTRIKKIVTPGTLRYPPMQIQLFYLVTAWNDSFEQERNVLTELLFSAIENQDVELTLDPLSITEWKAFCIIPRPSFMVSIVLQRDRVIPPTKLVEKPLLVKDSILKKVTGVLLGPKKDPVIGAKIISPYLQNPSITDSKGRFFFSSFPATEIQDINSWLQVEIENKKINIKVDKAVGRDGPLIIHLQPTEV